MRQLGAVLSYFQKHWNFLELQKRVEALVQRIAPAAGLSDAMSDATAAAQLCHADLATATVMEMTALAGTIGRHLAASSGASPEVWPSIPPHPIPPHLLDFKRICNVSKQEQELLPCVSSCMQAASA